MVKSLQRTDKEIAGLYENHFDAVYRVCFTHMKNAADAADMTHDTFVKLIRQGPGFASAAHERAWLIRTAMNLCRNSLKHWWRKREQLEDYENLQGKEAFQSDETLAALMNLPERYKTALYMYYYEGYSSAEIAQALGKPQSTILNHLHEARQILKNKLEGGVQIMDEQNMKEKINNAWDKMRADQATRDRLLNKVFISARAGNQSKVGRGISFSLKTLLVAVAIVMLSATTAFAAYSAGLNAAPPPQEETDVAQLNELITELQEENTELNSQVIALNLKIAELRAQIDNLTVTKVDPKETRGNLTWTWDGYDELMAQALESGYRAKLFSTVAELVLETGVPFKEPHWMPAGTVKAAERGGSDKAVYFQVFNNGYSPASAVRFNTSAGQFELVQTYVGPGVQVDVQTTGDVETLSAGGMEVIAVNIGDYYIIFWMDEGMICELRFDGNQEDVLETALKIVASMGQPLGMPSKPNALPPGCIDINGYPTPGNEAFIRFDLNGNPVASYQSIPNSPDLIPDLQWAFRFWNFGPCDESAQPYFTGNDVGGNSIENNNVYVMFGEYKGVYLDLGVGAYIVWNHGGFLRGFFISAAEGGDMATNLAIVEAVSELPYYYNGAWR
ncbi:MAG: sigma-70 family RNA polymerase sigma factor [Clostridiales bacterium]|nr:sigma-70 family RNA polymerase sigma factor [Clostridiales bacterium]